MVSKTRKKARKSAEAMREMLDQDSEIEGEMNFPPPHDQTFETQGNPTSTARLETDEQFERLSQEIETKINEGLTSTLSQFESRLESALESLRQTVSASLGGRSHVLTDQESDMDPHRDVPEGQNAQQHFGNFSTHIDNNNISNELNLGPAGVGNRGNEDTLTRQYCSNTSLGELPLDPQVNSLGKKIDFL